MAKRKTQAAPQVLTREQAAIMVDGWVIALLDNDQAIGDFLLLIRSLAYNTDATAREEILGGIENVLMPYMRSVGRAVDDLVEQRRACWQKGA